MTMVETGTLLLNSALYHKKLRTSIEVQPVDGSKVSSVMIDDLATLPGPILDKVFALYSCGVHDYQKEVFDPRQVLAMIRFNRPYKPNETIGRVNGNSESSFCYVGPNDKKELLSELCTALDNFDPTTQSDLDIQRARARLIERGVDKTIVSTMSNKALSTYFLANEAQFIFALIHPFWERNGRTSEEVLHLICAANGADQLRFYSDVNKRYNPATKERVKLIDQLSSNLLVSIEAQMGLPEIDTPQPHVDDVYKAWFKNKNRESDYSRLDRKRKNPIFRYLQSRTAFNGEPNLMQDYFSAVKAIVSARISRLSSSQFPQLLQDESTVALVAHHLSRGIRTDS